MVETGKVRLQAAAGTLLGGAKKATASVAGAVKRPNWSGHLLNAGRADDTDGSLAEMQQAYCAKKSVKHQVMDARRFERAAELLTPISAKADHYGIFGHSRSLVQGAAGGAPRYLPFADRRIG